jgi:hypothetical protein
MNLEELDFFDSKVLIFASNEIFICFRTIWFDTIGSPENMPEVAIRTTNSVAVFTYPIIFKAAKLT